MIKNLIFTNGKELRPGVMYGIGQNYAKHAKEMNSTVPAEPVIFIKPPSSYIPGGDRIKAPKMSNNVHHEVELVVVIGKECVNVSKEDAYKYIAGYAVGIDVTMRDLQNKAKTEGKPWAVCKGFATSAPISRIIPIEEISSDNPDFDIELLVNGEMRQAVNTSEMERSVGVLIEYLSEIFGLYPGDCIFTGTPEGVAKIQSGDKLFAELKGFTTLEVEVE
jgi:2-keto-4-pentenoate hydratase/2-oxohepta-3-ene-1,7-dioic acid hydratase in catechol pathway